MSGCTASLGLLLDALGLAAFISPVFVGSGLIVQQYVPQRFCFAAPILGQVWLRVHIRSLASVHFASDCLLLSEAVLPARWGDWSIGSCVHRTGLLPWEAVAFRFALLTLQGEPLLQWRGRCGQIAYKEPVAGFPGFASNCALWPF